MAEEKRYLAVITLLHELPPEGAAPPVIWGGGNVPMPSPPIVIPPNAIGPGVPTHPIYIPVYPAHPIVIPPGTIDPGPPLVPSHPIVLPPLVPGHPIVLPPDLIGPGVPSHPIYLPPPSCGGGNPPGTWGGAGEPFPGYGLPQPAPPHPAHPIAPGGAPEQQGRERR